MRRRPTLIAAAAFAGGFSLSASSHAHIDLLSPSPRASGIPDSYLLRGPCGQRSNGRVPDKVTTFRPGETIDVEWDVYVQHVSYFRISFDADGDDSFSSRSSAPLSPRDDDLSQLPAGDGELILGYVPDPGAQRDHIEERITLPNVQCDSCTLQLTQFTYGLPVKDAVYYQCADLVLAGELMDLPPPSSPSGTEKIDAGPAGVPAGSAVHDPGFVGSGEGCSIASGAGSRPSSPASPSPWLGAAACLTALGAAVVRRRAGFKA
jgi:hypothetical protein